MAEAKKYYWLRLQHDFFASKRIKKLRSMENGSECVIIYLKMQLQSIKDNGVLTYLGLEDSFEAELALDLDEDVENVEKTVQFLMKYGMLQEIEKNQFELSYAKGNIGSETAAACRMRELRANKVNFAENAEQNNHFADAGKMAGSDNDGLKNSVEQCSENVQQKRIEQSKEKPKKETVLQVYERLSQEIILPGMVEDKMMEWLKYKIERKESYKETGLKSLMKQVQKYVEQYGQESVVALIEECMGNNWAGIIWDRLEKGKVKTKQERMLNRVSEVDNW